MILFGCGEEEHQVSNTRVWVGADPKVESCTCSENTGCHNNMSIRGCSCESRYRACNSNCLCVQLGKCTNLDKPSWARALS